MEIVKEDGFDSTATADIVTFQFEEMQLLHKLQDGELQDLAASLGVSEDELGQYIDNLVMNWPDKDRELAISLAKAQLQKLKLGK
jgi:hypothetical protein